MHNRAAGELRSGNDPVASLVAAVSGDNADDKAWWVPSEDPTLIPDRLAELACALDLAATTDSAEAAVARLRGVLHDRGRWLIVFDNGEDRRAVAWRYDHST